MSTDTHLQARTQPQLPDLALARQAMVARLTARGLSPGAIEAIRIVPRMAFLPVSLWRLSHADLDLWRFGLGPSIYAAAELFDAAMPRAGERCVEIGTGCGWFSAVLAQATATVTTVDVAPGGPGSPPLSEYGVQALTAEALATRPMAVSPLASADVVIVSFAPPVVPRALLARLPVGARMVAGAGRPPQAVTVYVRDKSGFAARRAARPLTLGAHPILAALLDRIATPPDDRR